jgi:hypothetical protein
MLEIPSLAACGRLLMYNPTENLRLPITEWEQSLAFDTAAACETFIAMQWVKAEKENREFKLDLSAGCMKLRTHPLRSYRGVPNWPPTWVWIDGPEESRPKGEIGILRSVLLKKLQPANRCFLLIFHEDSSYLGCLLFDNEIFCRQLNCSRVIAIIPLRKSAA